MIILIGKYYGHRTVVPITLVVTTSEENLLDTERDIPCVVQD